MSEGPDDGTVWVAALEQLPPDARGFRRTLRLHAVAAQTSGAAPRAACGYEYRPGELRTGRAWGSVTATGRCPLCDRQLRTTQASGVALREVLDLGEPSAPDPRRRLSVVSDERRREGSAERRSPDRP